MIDFYTYATFNGRRVAIMLEEAGLDYQAHKVDLMKGEQLQPEFKKLNPSARIPVIVDHDENFVLTQSIAILYYLAEKSGRFLPSSIIERAKMNEFMNFHAIDIGGIQYGAFYLEHRIENKQPEAAEILKQRIVDLYRFFDQRLQDAPYFAGDTYSIADITVFPAVKSMESELQGYEHLMRWYQQVGARPAVQKGMEVAS